jgi:hypothetical protein
MSQKKRKENIEAGIQSVFLKIFGWDVPIPTAHAMRKNLSVFRNPIILRKSTLRL